MDRRQIIATGAAALGALSAGPALAGEEEPGAATVNISGVGLPVITDGRVRNYVFVALRLHLGSGASAEVVRAKEAWFRDALVKAAHRTPFVVPDDWTRLNANALSASLMRSATAIAGRGAVARVEVVSQAPRRRTGLPG